MTNIEKIYLIDQQIAEQNRLINRLENSEQLDFYRTPSSWSEATLRDRSAAVDVINKLQIAKKDLIISD